MSFLSEFDDEYDTRLSAQIAEDTAFFNEVGLRELETMEMSLCPILEARQKRKQDKKERNEKGKTKALMRKVLVEWSFYTVTK
jgi:hypothetical protein